MDYQKNKNKRTARVRARRKRLGVCVDCGANREGSPSQTYCSGCYLKHKRWTKNAKSKKQKTNGVQKNSIEHGEDGKPVERDKATQKHKPFTPYEDI